MAESFSENLLNPQGEKEAPDRIGGTWDGKSARVIKTEDESIDDAQRARLEGRKEDAKDFRVRNDYTKTRRG